jgi:hypothetical protein
MKKTILTAITALGIILGTAPTIATESISSLRGDHDLNADAVEATKKKEVSQKGGFEIPSQDIPCAGHRLLQAAPRSMSLQILAR